MPPQTSTPRWPERYWSPTPRWSTAPRPSMPTPTPRGSSSSNPPTVSTFPACWMPTATPPKSPKPDFSSSADWSAGHNQPVKERTLDGGLRSANPPCAQFPPEFAMSQSLYSAPLSDLELRDDFQSRHLGPNPGEIAAMLAAIGAPSMEALMDQTVPAAIRLPSPLDLPAGKPEHEALAELKAIAAKNVCKRSLIGLGYYDTLTPGVILRNVMENPGWYTAYTPYQAEIAQGRLEALLNYQQMVIDLTGLELANASLLDEATAAAEAMAMARRVSRVKSQAFFVDEACFPQTLDVVKTRAAWFGFELVVGPAEKAAEPEVFGALLQYPNERGEVTDLSATIAALKTKGAVVAVASDLMALVLLKSLGEMGADIALGSAQRFGVPMGFGGPHAAFFATREAHVRAMPGRIIGVSKDARGKPALRMTLQTREQHIRREKANSNICTSQVLLANMAGMYAVYHGPLRLQAIAGRIHRLAAIFASALEDAGFPGLTNRYFDTVQVEAGPRTESIYAATQAAGYNLRKVSNAVLGAAFDETSTLEDVRAVLAAFGITADLAALDTKIAASGGAIPEGLRRASPILSHPVFNTHHTEHEMLRYLKKLQNRDLALDHSMISLGSCTMKLNATSEMVPVTWREFGGIHPFAPREQAAQLRRAGRIRRPGGDPPLPRQPRRRPPRCVPHPQVRPRHQPRHRPDVRTGSRRGGLRRPGQRGCGRPCRQGPTARGAAGLLDDHLPLHPRGIRGGGAGDLRHRPRPGGPGLHGRRQPQRPSGAHRPRLHRCGRVPYEPPQDFLHSPWRRGSGDGPHRAQGPPGALHGRPCARPDRARRPPQRGSGSRLRRALRLRQHPAHFLDVHRHDGRGWPDPCHPSGHPQRQLHRQPPGRALPRALHGRSGPGCPRVHLGHPAHQGCDRHYGGGYRQAAHGLRIPCSHHVLPRGRHHHGGTHRIRGQRGAGPFHCRHGGHPRGNRGRGGRRAAGGRQPAEERSPHPGRLGGRLAPPLFPPAGRFPPALGGGEQVLAQR